MSMAASRQISGEGVFLSSTGFESPHGDVEAATPSKATRKSLSRSLSLRQTRMTAEEQVAKMLQSIAQMDLQVEEATVSDHRAMEAHLDHSADLHNGLLVERNARDLLENTSAESLRQVHRTGVQGYSDARQVRFQMVAQLERSMDQHAADLQGVIAEELAICKDSERHCQEVQSEIGVLFKTMQQAKKFRLEKGQKLGEAVKQKLVEVEEAIEAERRFRLDSQNTLLEMFGQMGKKMEQEMETCRKERLASTNRVLSVIETVLPRVENARFSQADNMAERVQDSGDAAAIARAMANNMAAKKGDIQRRKSLLFKGRLVNVG